MFTPGMFARIQMPAAPPTEALLVPDAAIGTEQVRKFVLVVDGENVARPKYVTLGPGRRRACAWSRRGSRPEDRVIVNGLMRARPGAKVTPQERRRQRRRLGTPKLRPGPTEQASGHAHLALLHRPADLRRAWCRSCS